MKPIILDCTLRDGGYYNNWNFDQDFAKKYCSSLIGSGIDCIEVGLRSLDVSGTFSNATDDIINSLEVDSSLKIGVLINVKEIENIDQIKKLIPSAEKLSFVRLAVTYDDAFRTFPLAEYLKSLGFTVTINVMRTMKGQREKLCSLAAEIKKKGLIDIFYIADSFGCMSSLQTRKIVSSISQIMPCGFHAHDNKGIALANTITALKSGAAWIDCTITGMGRGAGNCPTELLLTDLVRRRIIENVDLSDLYSFTMQHMMPLKEKHNWGCNLIYFLGADAQIHPSKLQSMCKEAYEGRLSYAAIFDQLT